MNKKMKKAIRTALTFIGLRITFVKPYDTELKRLTTLAKKLKISQIVDIGANSGQFAKEMRVHGFKGSIFSIEPVLEAYRQLKSNSQSDERWYCVERTAVAGSEGTIDMYRTENTECSSLIQPTELLDANLNEAARVVKQKITTKRLDTIIEEYQIDPLSALLKIDTQGTELEILRSAGRYISNFQLIHCELSFQELYKEQALWNEVDEYLTKHGFCLWSLEPTFRCSNGQLLQADATYINKQFNKV